MDYRKGRVNNIKEITFNLISILPMDITKIESIPYKELQDMRKKVDEWLFLINAADREGISSHISANDQATTTEDRIKNSFHVDRENYETPARAYKKISKGEE